MGNETELKTEKNKRKIFEFLKKPSEFVWNYLCSLANSWTFWTSFVAMFLLLWFSCSVLNVSLEWPHYLGLVAASFFFTPHALLPLFKNVLNRLSGTPSWNDLKGDTKETLNLDFSDKFLKVLGSFFLICSSIIAIVLAFTAPAFKDFLYSKEVSIQGSVSLDGRRVLSPTGGYIEAIFYNKDEKEINQKGEVDTSKQNFRRRIPIVDGFYESEIKVPKFVQGAKLKYYNEGFFAIGAESVKEEIINLNIYHDFNVNLEPNFILKGKKELEIIITTDSTFKIGNNFNYVLKPGDTVTVFENYIESLATQMQTKRE